MRLIDADKLPYAMKDYFDGKKTIGQIIDDAPTVEMAEDCVKREDVLNAVYPYCPDDDGSCSKAGDDLRNLLDEIEDLPSVTPLTDVLDKIRAEIAEYGSIWVTYAITDKTKTDEGIEKLVTDVLSEAKRQVLGIIDKYRAESENKQ